MVIVDAYNVLLAEGVGGIDLGELETLAGVSRFARRGVVLVCDGVRKAEAKGLYRAAGRHGEGVRIVAAGPGKDADSLIEGMLASDSAPGRLMVVSDDRRLRRAARRVRAAWMGSEAFVQRLRSDARRKGPAPLPSFATALPLDEGSVEHWLRHFGVPAGASAEEFAGLDEEASAPAKATKPTERRPAPTTEKNRDGARPPKPKKTELPRGEVIDPLLLDALEEWAIRPEDLDMGRWLE